MWQLPVDGAVLAVLLPPQLFTDPVGGVPPSTVYRSHRAGITQARYSMNAVPLGASFTDLTERASCGVGPEVWWSRTLGGSSPFPPGGAIAPGERAIRYHEVPSSPISSSELHSGANRQFDGAHARPLIADPVGRAGKTSMPRDGSSRIFVERASLGPGRKLVGPHPRRLVADPAAASRSVRAGKFGTTR